jgi:hypothetical protein
MELARAKRCRSGEDAVKIIYFELCFLTILAGNGRAVALSGIKEECGNKTEPFVGMNG